MGDKAPFVIGILALIFILFAWYILSEKEPPKKKRKRRVLMDSNKLPKHIIHPKGDANLDPEEADTNWLGLDFTPDMENAYKNGFLKRLKSEYNVTNLNEYEEKEDDIDFVWCCADVTAHSFNFDFGLKKEDYKDESDYDMAIADKWEHYFHNSEEQVIINMCYEYLSSYLE